MRRQGFGGIGRAAALLAALSGTGCSTVNSVTNSLIGGSAGADEPKRLTGFIGAVVADEPRAALAGREVLALGGSAADAAVAVGFALAVTLPSRAGLGGAGACLAYDPNRNGPGGGVPEAIVFTSPAHTAAPGSDRPAGLPMVARGLFALHARYGAQPFESLISPAEQMARFGVQPSRALLRDIAVVAAPLAADPNARAVFLPDGQVPQAESTLSQPDLGSTLSQLRTAGVGDLYQGALARRFEQGARIAGGGVSLADLRAALPRALPALTVPAGRDQVSFLPPPADGGLAAAAAFQTLLASPNDVQGAQARALAAAARWRQGGGDPRAILAGGGGGTLGELPASTSYVTLDRAGRSVACAVSMGNLFGTGRIAPGTGMVLAAAPPPNAAPLLAAGIAWNGNLHAFRAAVSGSGQDGAALAVAAGLVNALRSRTAMPAPVPEPGRANAIACSSYLPDTESSCTQATDPRGAGLAASGS